MQICANKVVLVDFTLTDEAGEVLDSSVNDEPLAYLPEERLRPSREQLESIMAAL
jgi:FKBP-type peptidyl-prolyl cis-trans isomerase SlyD